MDEFNIKLINFIIKMITHTSYTLTKIYHDMLNSIHMLIKGEFIVFIKFKLIMDIQNKYHTIEESLLGTFYKNMNLNE